MNLFFLFQEPANLVEQLESSHLMLRHLWPRIQIVNGFRTDFGRINRRSFFQMKGKDGHGIVNGFVAKYNEKS